MGQCFKKDLRKLQLVKNKAARLILRCLYRTNINRMHFDLKWLKVEDRMIAAILLSTWFYILKLHWISIINYNLTFSHMNMWATEGRFLLPYAKTHFLKRKVSFRAIKL